MAAILKFIVDQRLFNVGGRLIFSFGLLIFLSLEAGASNSVCSRQDAIKAETEAASLKTWRDVWSSYSRYKSCDEGSISEAYSGSIGALLSNQWHRIDDLLKISRAHPQFERFVLRHIDQTLTEEQGAAIKMNAQLNCPQKAKRFCASVIRRFADLDLEIKQIQSNSKGSGSH